MLPERVFQSERAWGRRARSRGGGILRHPSACDCRPNRLGRGALDPWWSQEAKNRIPSAQRKRKWLDNQGWRRWKGVCHKPCILSRTFIRRTKGLRLGLRVGQPSTDCPQWLPSGLRTSGGISACSQSRRGTLILAA